MEPLSQQPPRDSRSWQILDLVGRQGEMTVAEMVTELGITTTAVRQQLNRLMAEGWLAREKRCSGPGRPADIFSLSDRAKRLFAQQVDEFGSLLLEEVFKSLDRSKLRSILEGVGRRMTSELRSVVGEGRPEEVMERLADAFEERGILSHSSDDKKGASLKVFTCPYHGIAIEHREICDMHREVISLLVGRHTSLENCMLDGHQCCEFAVANT